MMRLVFIWQAGVVAYGIVTAILVLGGDKGCSLVEPWYVMSEGFVSLHSLPHCLGSVGFSKLFFQSRTYSRPYFAARSFPHSHIKPAESLVMLADHLSLSFHTPMSIFFRFQSGLHLTGLLSCSVEARLTAHVVFNDLTSATPLSLHLSPHSLFPSPPFSLSIPLSIRVPGRLVLCVVLLLFPALFAFETHVPTLSVLFVSLLSSRSPFLVNSLSHYDSIYSCPYSTTSCSSQDVAWFFSCLLLCLQ